MTSVSCWMRLGTVIVILVLGSLPCQAATLTVGPGVEDFSHIQPAIDAANAGDVVIVSASTYTENLRIFNKDILLQSANPTDPSVVEATIIDGNASGSVITLADAETPACEIAGFTITNGFEGMSGQGGGIDGRGTHATIRYNVIRNNSVGPFSGMGLGVGGGIDDCDGLIEYNTVINNTSRGHGGGFNGCDGMIRNNLVQGNRTAGGGGGGGFARCGATIQNNLVIGNFADFYGGAMWACNGHIENNTLYGNRAYNSYYNQAPILARGGGTAFCGGPFLNNILWANTAQSEPQTTFSVSIAYCCIQDWTEGGEGNFSDNPQFVQEFLGDFRLLHTSPCIDSGTTIAGLTDDFQGDPRPHGSKFDIGADEWDGIVLPSPTPTFTSTPYPTDTPAPTPTPTPTPTFTGIPPTSTPTPTDTRTPTLTATPTSTPTITNTPLPFADLSVSIVDDYDPAFATTYLNYTVTLHNNGPIAANAIILHVTFPLSGEFSFMAEAPLNCDIGASDGRRLSCSMPTLLAGSSLRSTYTLKVDSVALDADPDGTFTFEAFVVALTQDPDLGNNYATEDTGILAADLSVEVEIDQEVAFASDEVSYTVIVGNAGPSDAEVIRMTLDKASASATIDADPGWFHTAPDGGQLEFVYPVLEPGATTSIRITEFVEAGAAGRFVRSADIYSNVPDANQSDNRDTGSVNIIQNLSHASPDARFAAVAAAGTHVYVVWQEVPPGNPPGNFDIFFTRSEDRGVTFSPPVNLSNSTDLSRAPSVAATGENVYVAWHDEKAGVGSEVATRISTDAGANFGPAIYPEIDSEVSSFYADLSVGENRFYVLWEGAGIWVRPYNFDGIPADDAVQLDEQPNIIGGSKFAASGDRVYVVWMSDRDNAEQEYDVLYSSSANQGETFTAPNKIANHSDAGWIPIPVIAAYDENVYIAWTEQSGATPFIQSADGGQTFGDSVDLFSLHGIRFPSLAAYGDRLHLTWSPFGVTEVYFMALTKESEILVEPESIAGTREGIFRIRIAASGPDVYVTWSEEVDVLSDVYLWKRQIPLPVRVVYLVPSDREYQPCYRQAIEEAILHVQEWYRDELLTGNTFALHDPIVEVYNTVHEATYYATHDNGFEADRFHFNVRDEGLALAGGVPNDPKYRWIFYIDADPVCGQTEGAASEGAAAMPANDLRGLVGLANIPVCASPPDTGGRCRWVGGLAHELGHTFGLPHPPGCDEGLPTCVNDYLMAAGYANYPLAFLTSEDREILNESPFFVAIEPIGGDFKCEGVADGCIENDFSIHAAPIQAIPNPNRVVAGKRTLLKVEVTSSYAGTETAEIQLDYETVSGTRQVVESNLSIPPGKSEHFFPSEAFILPPPSGFEARVEIRSANPAVDEPIQDNNAVGISLPAVSTQDFRVLAVPLLIPNDPVTQADWNSVIRVSVGSDFIEGILPISYTGFDFQRGTARFRPAGVDAPLSNEEVKKVLKQLANLRWVGDYTRVVGVVRRDFIETQSSFGPLLGLSFSTIPSCLVEEQNSSGVAVAHEIAHTFNLAWDHPLNAGLDCGAPGVDCAHVDNLFVSGYWVGKRRPMFHLDLMHSVATLPFSQDRWIGEGTYNVLLEKLRVNSKRGKGKGAPSPYFIGLSGELTRAGAMTLDPCYRFLGEPDIPLDGAGDYRIHYLDESGSLLAETGFDLRFDSPADAPHAIVDEDVFSLKIPDVTGTASLVIRNGSGTLVEREVSLSPPQVSLIAPNGGELYETGETLTVRWQAEDLDGDDLYAAVCISTSETVQWIPLAMDHAGEEYQFTIPEPLVTETGRVRVIVTDGWNTTEAVSASTFAIIENTCPPGNDPCRLLKLLGRIQKGQAAIVPLLEMSLDWYTSP